MENFTIFNSTSFSNNDTDVGEEESIFYPDPDPFSYPPYFRYICYILYNLVFLFALVGNLLVFYTIHYTHPKMKTVQNYFLGNLALGDLLIVIFCVPTGYLSILWQYWAFGRVLCHILTPVKAVGVFVSSYTLVALAVDRYLAILYPLKMGLTRRQCKWTLFGVWIGSVITAGPVAWNSRIEVHLESNLERCGEYGWESLDQELAYSLILLILQYIFPVVVLVYTYGRICWVVWLKNRDHPQHGPGLEEQRSWIGGGGRRGQQQQPLTSRGKRKTIILSLSVVIGYTLAWLPYNIVYMIYKHGPVEIMDADFFPYLFLTCHFLAMAHSMYNPIIYFWINDRFRKAFVGVVLVKFPRLGRFFTGGGGDNSGSGWRSSLTTTGGDGTSRRGTRLESLRDNAANSKRSVLITTNVSV